MCGGCEGAPASGPPGTVGVSFCPALPGPGGWGGAHRTRVERRWPVPTTVTWCPLSGCPSGAGPPVPWEAMASPVCRT